MIISIGYGFGDDHINKMISQALRNDVQKRLVVVDHVKESEADAKALAVAEKLGVSGALVRVVPNTAKRFLERVDLDQEVKSFLPDPPGAEF